MKLLLSYIKKHSMILIGGVLTVTVFFIVFSSYSLPVEPVVYASVLSAVLLLVIGFIRFLAYYRRNRELKAIEKNILISLEALPQPLDFIEEDYQRLIRILNREHLSLSGEKDRLICDMNDYYTTWAHQIKTPIAAMRLLLQSRNADTEQAEELAEQLFRIEQYVEMVLGYIRSENISGDLVICYRNLDELVRQSVKKYSRQFIRKHISLVYEEFGVQALTDEKWFCFVLEQLLMNALKYTESGSITIKLTREEDGNGTFTVADTGVGIPPEDLPRIGEKGFTGYNGREDKKSTGIGLYLCRKITARLSHSFRIESKPGCGTTVFIGNLNLKE